MTVTFDSWRNEAASDGSERPAYGRRNHAETAMGRYKHLIGPKLRARTLPGQRGAVAIAVNVLNRMIRTEKPVSLRAR